jgi:signal recognition particle GTPase
MQFTLKALLDEESRKEIRAVILGEARTLARNLIDETVTGELKRILGKLEERYRNNDWLMKGMVREVLKEIIEQHYDSIHNKIEVSAVAAVESAVQVKLKNKTVWEASSQEAYIRKVVRKELAAMLSVAKNTDI